MSQIIYVLTGLPGSGKSTWAAKKAADRSCIVISRDVIRTMIGGNGKYVHEKTTESVVKEMATACALAALNEGFDVIIDECTPRSEGRSYWPMALGDSFSSKYKFILVYFPEKKRNVDFRMKGDARGLSRDYWSEVVGKMSAAYQIPNKDYNQGFAEMITVEIE